MLVTPYNKALNLYPLRQGSQVCAAIAITYIIALAIIFSLTSKSLGSFVSYMKTNTPFFLTPVTLFISICLATAYIYRKRIFTLLEKQKVLFEKTGITEKMGREVFAFIKANYHTLLQTEGRNECTTGAIHAVKDHQRNVRLIYVSNKLIGEGSISHVHYSVDWLTTTIFACSISKDNVQTEKGFDIERHIHQPQFNPKNVKAPSFGIIKFNDQFSCFDKLYDGDLRDLINDREYRFTENEQRSLTHQLLNGLATLERASIYHVDISAENIFYCKVDDEIHLDIADFNLASKLTPESNNERIPGKPLYLPPELSFRVKLGIEKFGKYPEDMRKYLLKTLSKHDVWSMGLIIGMILNQFRIQQIQTPLERIAKKYAKKNDPNLKTWIDGYEESMEKFFQYKDVAGFRVIPKLMLKGDYTRRWKASDLLAMFDNN